MRKARLLAEAEAEEAEMLARLRLESANIEAEEKILASRSLVGSKIGSVSSAQSRVRSRRSLIKETSNESKKVLPVSKMSDDANALNHNLFVKKEEIVKPKKTFSSSKFWNLEAAHLNFDKTNVETKPKIPVINRDHEFALTSATRAMPLRSFRDENVCSAQVHTGIDRGKIFPDTILHSSETELGETTLHTYLERQGRNEFINLATQIGYDGKNIAFVFYENQVRRLMEESPYDERRLEVLRASCTGEPREMVNLFCSTH